MSDEEDQWHLRLTDAMNTYNPALTVLNNKGYHLYFVPDKRPQFLGDFWAIKDGRVFSAMDPLRLLGLIGMWEGMGDGWYHQRYEDIWDKLTAIGFAEGDFHSWDDDAFQQLTTELRLLFDAMGENLPEPVTRAGLAQIIKSWSEGEEIAEQDLRGE
jgi:hypothetical protein